MRYLHIAGIMAILLLAVTFLLVIVGVNDLAGVPVLSAGDFAGGYLGAGNFSAGVFAAGTFSVGVFATGMFSIGIFSAGIFSIGVFSVGIFNIGLYSYGICRGKIHHVDGERREEMKPNPSTFFVFHLLTTPKPEKPQNHPV